MVNQSESSMGMTHFGNFRELYGRNFLLKSPGENPALLSSMSSNQYFTTCPHLVIPTLGYLWTRTLQQNKCTFLSSHKISHADMHAVGNRVSC